METLKEIQLMVDGMTCGGCEVAVEKKLLAISGVTKVKASYKKGRVEVTFDERKIKLKLIQDTLSKLGYPAKGVSSDNRESAMKVDYIQMAYIVLVLWGLFFFMNHFGLFSVFNAFPQAQAGMGYVTLFIVGLLTSVHCIAMCGGINLTQCVVQMPKTNGGKLTNLRPSFLYNAGRVISYTLVGGIVGALGSVVSFSGVAKGIVAILAGAFMIIMGLNMLNLFPWLRRFAPHLPKFLIKHFGGSGQGKGPFYVGLLNGLMPCGPLQAMQLYALSTGSPIKGALSMFFFSIGTVPLMFGFGALSSLLSKKFTQKMLRISAVLVVLLGLVMLNNGLGLSGININLGSAPSQSVEAVSNDESLQTVRVELSPNGYKPITVKAGIPVKWIIVADEKNITGCNNEIIIPRYGIAKKLTPGENVIEFTPDEAGVVQYSCWMGMIRSQITVLE